MSNLLALTGAAMFLALSRADSMVGAILLIPMMKMTFFGPQVMAATLLPLPSIFIMTPSSDMALALVRYTSAEKACKYICCFSSGVGTLSLSRIFRVPRDFRKSGKPISRTVAEPPHVTVSPSLMRDDTFSTASFAVGQ